MQKKLEYTIVGCTLSLFNIALIGTRFQIIGQMFGLIAAITLIRALFIRR